MPSEMDGLPYKKQEDRQDSSAPQLNQAASSTYFVYNCYYPVMQDYSTQPQLQGRNSMQSTLGEQPYPLILKHSESIPLPQLTTGLSMPSFQFGASNPFIKQDDMIKSIPPQNNFASFIINEQLKQQNQPTRNRIIEGTQALCDVEIVLISRYFDLKAQVFCPPNNKYTLKEDRNLSNADWIKDRMQYRYKKAVKESFFDLVEVIEREGELSAKQATETFRFNQSGFDAVERQVPKSVKQEKPFSIFIFEIQQLLSQFIFTKF